ncbi:MAG TPA: transcriptional regulator GcvA [Sphingomicrobium sp.]|jgi:LysR family glycine cleavage system transcriptional activator|nr:transcriptional regulator GcvA [Sphingomicrobium sp.]
MVNKKLAHLNALRAFEAVARHTSFAKASAELSVTPGAISQQIKLLEDFYGVRLFRREGRRIALTDDAAKIVPELTAGFDLLARAIASLQARKAGGIVRVTTPPTFAVKWLAQRLGEFAIAHPGIQVSVESTGRLVDLRREEANVGIRYGTGPWRGLTAELMFDETLTPVCSPSYLEQQPIESIGGLGTARLIHDRTMESTGLDYPDWDMWFERFGMTAPQDGALHFSSSLAAIQAAVDGHGVILGRSALIAADLKEGRLVAAGPATASGSSYYLVTPDDGALSSPVRTFRTWLLEEAAKFRSERQPG